MAEAWDATPHLETGLEIALRLAPSYSEIAYVQYGDILPACEFSSQSRISWARRIFDPAYNPASKGIRAARQYDSLCSLSLKFIDVSDFKLPADFVLGSDSFESLDSLRRTCFYDNNIFGISLVSSLVSLTSNSAVNPSDHRTLVNDLANGFARCFHLISNLLASDGYDALVLFNGRFASVKGAVLAAAQLSKPVFFHERGCSMEKFSLKDYQPHDRIRFQEDIREHWNKANKGKAAIQIAKDFFVSKRAGKEQGWTSFKDKMIAGASSSIIADARSRTRPAIGKVICFFSSSEDEYLSTEGVFETSGFEWQSQSQACAALAKAADKNGHSLIIRNHPHLQYKAHADRAKWDNLEFMEEPHKAILIKSNSAVDTYELIDYCDLVVVYGSTVGIEAVFWGKPVIAMSDTLYDEIGASIYKPLTYNELDALIGCIDNLLVDQNSALLYGYYLSTFGASFQLYKPSTLFRGKFLGIDLAQRSAIRRLAFWAKKMVWDFAMGLRA